MKYFFLFITFFSLGIGNEKKYKDYEKISSYEKLEEIKGAMNRYHNQPELYTFLLFRYALKSHNVDISVRNSELIEKVYDEYNNPRILVYLGATKTLIGRDSKNPVKKMFETMKGIGLIKKAKKKRDSDIIIRLTSGLTLIKLPSFFGYKKEGIKDLLFVIYKYEKESIRLGEDTISSIYYILGKYYKGEGKINTAKMFLRKSAKFQTKYGKKAKLLLEIISTN